MTGKPHTPEHRAKISAALRRHKKTPEHIAKIAASLRGRVVPPEVRAKVSARTRERMAEADIRARVLAGQITRVEARGQAFGTGYTARAGRFYDALLEAQDGGCGLCGAKPRNGRRLHVDHDHRCCRGCARCVRGLLCARCNLVVGVWKTFITDNLDAVREWAGRAR